MSDLATLVGELHGVGTLAFGVLDGDVAVALGLLHDILELAAVETENLHQLALSGAVVVDEGVQQRALAALVAFRAVLVKGEADELAGLLELREGLGCLVHGGSFSLISVSLGQL